MMLDMVLYQTHQRQVIKHELILLLTVSREVISKNVIAICVLRPGTVKPKLIFTKYIFDTVKYNNLHQYERVGVI